MPYSISTLQQYAPQAPIRIFYHHLFPGVWLQPTLSQNPLFISVVSSSPSSPYPHPPYHFHHFLQPLLPFHLHEPWAGEKDHHASLPLLWDIYHEAFSSHKFWTPRSLPHLCTHDRPRYTFFPGWMAVEMRWVKEVWICGWWIIWEAEDSRRYWW